MAKYAVVFDLDVETLRQCRGDSIGAYAEIKRFMKAEGFTWQEGNVCFGDDRINAVTCVMAVSRLSRELPWLRSAARSIQMLRIEEINDLKPALDAVAENSPLRSSNEPFGSGESTTHCCASLASSFAVAL